MENSNTNEMIKNEEKSKNIKELSIDFLICCYFGQSKDLVKAAIDRAYIDMASHTLKGFDDNNNEKWECRYNSYIWIRQEIENYNNDNFKQWHSNVIKGIKSKYKCDGKEKLTEGQAQKWLNMTIKYIFVFKQVLEEQDSRLKEIKTFFDNTNENEYYLPIDSYVLKGSEVCDIRNLSWSTLDEEGYNKVMDFLGEKKDFIWELEKWESFAKEYSNDSPDSYNKYFKNKNSES